MIDDDEPEPGFWRCACGAEVPETHVYCGCGEAHPFSSGDPFALDDGGPMTEASNATTHD